jgi:hypothetical protein
MKARGSPWQTLRFVKFRVRYLGLAFLLIVANLALKGQDGNVLLHNLEVKDVCTG